MGFLAAIYPPSCIGCSALLAGDEKHFCRLCLEKAIFIDTKFTGIGLKKRHFDLCMSLALFEGPFEKALHDLKYNRRTDIAAILGEMLISKVDFEYDVITNVPLHRKRLVSRGYNQAGLIASRMASLLGAKWRPAMIRRDRDTPSQVGLSAARRLENIQGAFSLGDVRLTPDKDILLIDDVITTGATANECAAVLKNGGAGRVDVLTVARAV